MDLTQEQTKQQFTQFAAKHGPAAIVPATVLQINGDDTIRVQLSDDAEVDDVRLKSVVKNGDRFLLIPKVDSIVQVGRIENSDELLVLAVEEITEVKWEMGTLSFSATADGFRLQKGPDTLKEILKNVIEAVLQIVVLQGTNPDYLKLKDALLKTQNLFADAS